MKRRRFLLGAVVLLVAVVLGALARPRQAVRWVADALKPKLDRSSTTGRLDGPELEAVVALAEALVADAPLPEHDRRAIAEHVDDRTRTRPGYLALYRSTAQTLDRLGPAPFASLGFADRIDLVTRHQLERSNVRVRERFRLSGRSVLAVRALAGPDLVSAYYLSPAGWAAVGYRVFPGRCGDLERYMAPER